MLEKWPGLEKRPDPAQKILDRLKNDPKIFLQKICLKTNSFEIQKNATLVSALPFLLNIKKSFIKMTNKVFQLKFQIKVGPIFFLVQLLSNIFKNVTLFGQTFWPKMIFGEFQLLEWPWFIGCLSNERHFTRVGHLRATFGVM